MDETCGPDDAPRLAGEACRAGAGLIVVSGGDGTVGGVLSGLPSNPPPILVAPAGTENVLARCLGLRANVVALWEAFRRWQVVEIDLAQCNGRRFMIVLGAGFDGEVVRRLVEGRRGNISYRSYVGPIWRTLREFTHPHLTVEADGERVFDDRGLVILGHLPRYALGLRILSRANWRDGLLDVVALPCRGTMDLIAHSLRTLVGRHLTAPGVVYRQARQVRISSPVPVPYQMDGEFGGWLPVGIDVLPNRARFLAAPGRFSMNSPSADVLTDAGRA